MREFKESITGRDDRTTTTMTTTRRAPQERREVEAALGRPEGEQAPLAGEAERSPR